MDTATSSAPAPANTTERQRELSVEELQQIYAHKIVEARARQREQWDAPMFVAVLLGCLGLFSLITAYLYLPDAAGRSSSPYRPQRIVFTTIYILSTWLGIIGFVFALFSNFKWRKLAYLINGLILSPPILFAVFALGAATLIEFDHVWNYKPTPPPEYLKTTY